ncbi:MAG: YncE family protein [Prevotellaceae bacterium]|jgi:hypothetical protein|nr:YncE family protein [Prevotellaceae bacterium]
MKYINTINCLTLILALCTGCRKDLPINESTKTQIGDTTNSAVAGFYLLNEGTMGSNKATLDYYNYSAPGTYHRNIFSEINPTLVASLGDIGNDLQVYGQRLYAVINGSNLIEVMNVANAGHIGKINIPNCRYIVFNDGKAYVSSFAGPVETGNSQQGYISEIDTATLSVLRTVVVGYQPEEMAVVNGKLFVANSGGYDPTMYDNTLSVVDLETFREEEKITVGINLHRVRTVGNGRLYVSSRGNYADIPSSIYVVDTETRQVVKRLDVTCNNLCIQGDTAYVISSEGSYETGLTYLYNLIDTRNDVVLPNSFITDGTAANIQTPYGIAIHPVTGNVFITDVGNYILSGKLYCFSPDGTFKWLVTTGDIPSIIAFHYKTGTK